MSNYMDSTSIMVEKNVHALLLGIKCVNYSQVPTPNMDFLKK